MFLRVFAAAIALTPGMTLAQLPFDPSAIDQLTPEQRQQALETLGASSSSTQGQAQSDGRFRDRPLSDPLNDNTSSNRARTGEGSRNSFDANRQGNDSGRNSRSSSDYGCEPDDGYGDGYSSQYDDRYGDSNGRSNDGQYDPRSDSRDSSSRSDLDRNAAAAAYGRDDQRSDSGYGNSERRTSDDRDYTRNANTRDGRRGNTAFNDCVPSRNARRSDLDSRRGGAPLRPFGYDLFRRATTTFAPATDIPIPSDYVIGPGDSVRVQLFGNENGNYSLQVARDGHINFPKLGPISVAGQRFEDVKTSLSERITRELIGVQSSISLGELRSIRIFLTGDVTQPGSYTVSSLASMSNALSVGGGVAIVGSLRNVQLKRNGRLVRTLDLYSLLLNGDASADERLQPGDVIFVPPVGPRVSVDGEVKRPAIYELKGERSVSGILALAGGLLASTNTGTAQIERYERNKKNVRQVNLAQASDLAARVQDGDFLRVGSIARRLENKVRVIGYVKYPGAFEWSEGYQLKAALEAAQIQASDTDNETYYALGLVERTDPQSGVRSWLSFSVPAIIGSTSTPFPLERDDLIVILNRNDVAYLDSKEVRAVASGNFAAVNRCPGLEGLARLINSERSVRFLKSFNAENSREGINFRQSFNDTTCPDIFRQAPRALQYLLEESVAVYGEVRRPGLYPVAPNTPLKLLIETAGGLSNESDTGNVEYISYQSALQSGSSKYDTLNLKQEGTYALSINPGDLFNFKPLYLGQESGTVRVSGEFKFPGSYSILRGERLSQLIRRAGGLSSNSYPYGAVFTRVSARVAEQESYRRAAADLQEAAVTAVTSGALGKDAQISSQFLSNVVQRLQDVKAVGRVVIEADPTVIEARQEIDPILEPGDSLFVPKRPISVTVIGQVLNPGSLGFMPGASLKQYIERAGGYSQAADDGRVFVILPNGTAQKFNTSFWNYRNQDIPPGSLIVVPRDAAPFNAIVFSERIFGLLSNLALTAAALASVTR